MKIRLSTRISDFPAYGKLSKEEHIETQTKLLNLIKKISYDNGFKWEDILINYDAVSEIVDLIDRRRIYFHVYHRIEMGELNEACLRCFWILKLSPFAYKANPNKNINFIFALSLFTRAVNFTAEKRGVKANFNKDVIIHLEHAFKYRDLSKEAIMAIAESLIS